MTQTIRNIIIALYIFAAAGSKGQVTFSTTLPLEKGGNGHSTTTISAFDIYGRTYVPDDTVTVTWDDPGQRFLVRGNAFTEFAGENLHLSFGDQDSSVFIIQADSTLGQFKPLMRDTFVAEGLPLIAKDNNTIFTYDPVDDEYHLWGDVTIGLDDGAVDADFGNSDSPGLVIHESSISEVYLHVTDPLVMKGLTLAADVNSDLIIKRKAGDPSGKYFGHGTVYIELYDAINIAIAGNNASPGIIIQDGSIDSVKMLVGGGGLLFGVIPILDAFTLEYNHDHNAYAANGMITIGIPFGGVAKFFGARYTPSLKINAGSGTEAGFIYNLSTHRFDVNDATFSLQSVNGSKSVALGGFELNDLTIKVLNNLPDSINCRVTMPPGMSIDGSLGFLIRPDAPKDHRFTVTSIMFDWTVGTDLLKAPALGTTGFNVVEVAGAITGFNSQKNLKLDATVGLTYGAPFEIDAGVFGIPGISGKKDVVLAYFRESMELSLHGLTFSSLGDLGALFTSGQWQPILGQADVDVDITFGKSTMIDGMLTIYGPPLDFITAQMNLRVGGNGNCEGFGKVTLQIPHAIPIIGGKHIGNVEGAINHKTASTSSSAADNESYAAGWFTIHIPFDKIHLGIKSDLKTGHTTKIGAGEEKAIVKEVQNEMEVQESQDSTFQFYECNMIHNFTVDEIKPAAYFQNELIIKNPGVYVDPMNTGHPPVIAAVHSPNNSVGVDNIMPMDSVAGTYNNAGAYAGLDGVHIDVSMIDTIRWITYNDAAMAYADIDWPDQPDVLMSPGAYYLSVNGWCPVQGQILNEDDYTLNVSPVYPKPTIDLTYDIASGKVFSEYSSYLTDSTIITLYYSLSDTGNAQSIYTYTYGDGAAIGDSVHQIQTTMDPGAQPQHNIYVSARIDDHVNQPIYSNVIEVPMVKRITGSVSLGTDSVLVVLQDADSMKTHVVADLYASPDNPGTVLFDFYNVPTGHYQVHCYSHDTTYAFAPNTGIYNVSGNVEGQYLSPSWAYVDFTQPDWDNGQVQMSFNLYPELPQLYGNIVDTAGNTILDAKIYLLDAQDSILASAVQNIQGYAFFGLDTAVYYNIAAVLPDGALYHWDMTRRDRYFDNTTFFGVAQYLDSIYLSSDPLGIDFIAYEGDEGSFIQVLDENGQPIPGTVVILRSSDTSTYPDVASIANVWGIAAFEQEELHQFGTYHFDIVWPDGYQAGGVPSQFSWYGFSSVISIFGESQ